MGVFSEDAKRSADFGQPMEKEEGTIAQEFLFFFKEEFHLKSPYPKFRVQIDAKTGKGFNFILALEWKPTCGLKVLC